MVETRRPTQAHNCCALRSFVGAGNLCAQNLARPKPRRTRVAVNTTPQDPIPAVLALCDAAASKIGPPVRGAEPLWSCVEALRAASNGDFELGVAVERELFSRVSGGFTPADKVVACCSFCVGVWVLSQEQLVVWGVAHATCVFFLLSFYGGSISNTRWYTIRCHHPRQDGV